MRCLNWNVFVVPGINCHNCSTPDNWKLRPSAYRTFTSILPALLPGISAPHVVTSKLMSWLVVLLVDSGPASRHR